MIKFSVSFGRFLIFLVDAIIICPGSSNILLLDGIFPVESNIILYLGLPRYFPFLSLEVSLGLSFNIVPIPVMIPSD